MFNIFLTTTATDNHIYKIGGFAIEIRFQNNGYCQFLNLKSSASTYNIITTKATFPHFVILRVGLYIEKIKEHKSLFKLDSCLLQSINLCLVTILPKVFEVWRFPFISLTFGNTFGLLGLYVDINGKISSFFFSFSLLSYSCGIARVISIPFWATIFRYFWVFNQNCS